MAIPKTKFFVITCSADGTVNMRFLYAHGEGNSHALPTTIKEAKKRIWECYKKMACDVCDSEIHGCAIARKVQTFKNGYGRNINKIGPQLS